jgi:hypothetical protein
MLFAQTFYSRYLLGYISGRSLGTVSTLFGDFISNIKTSIITIVGLMHRDFFTWPVIVICVLCFAFCVFRKQKLLIQKSALYLLAVAMLYSIVVTIMAPYKVLRYMMPVFPFFIVLPVMILNSISKKKITVIAALLLSAAFSINALNRNNIEFLYTNKPDEYYFTKDIDIPVFVFNKQPWKYGNLVPYLADEQLYYFIDTYEDIQLTKNREFYLVSEAGFEKHEINQFEVVEEIPICWGEEAPYYYFVCRKYIMIEMEECFD